MIAQHEPRRHPRIWWSPTRKVFIAADPGSPQEQQGLVYCYATERFEKLPDDAVELAPVRVGIAQCSHDLQRPGALT